MPKDDEQIFMFYFLFFNLFDVILQNHKCVQLEDIAAEFKLRTQVFSIHLMLLDAVIDMFLLDSEDELRFHSVFKQLIPMFFLPN